MEVEFTVMDRCTSDTSSSSNSDENETENEVDLINDIHRTPQIRKRCRVSNYIETIIYRYSATEFEENFRMNRTSFEYLLSIVRPHIEGNISGLGKFAISAEKQLFIALYILGNSDTYRIASTRFNVGKETVWCSLQRVVQAICKYRSYFIRWPTESEANSLFQRIKDKYGFPKVLGVVDGTHIQIPPPQMDARDYINKQNVHSIQLQVICNDKLEFIHCFTGFPGSVHDMRIFKYSGVQQRCNEMFFPQNSHLIGDRAYTIQKHVMVPFKDNGELTMEEVNFNKTLLEARMMVERSIGLLKSRWRCLGNTFIMERTHLVAYYILCCCILHNVCLMPESALHDLPPLIPHEANEKSEPLLLDKTSRQLGIQKRQNICNLLNNN